MAVRMRALTTVLLIPLIAALAACADQRSSPPASNPEITAWRSKVAQKHALVGRIWVPAEQSFVDPAGLLSRLRSATCILLGEKHDNEDHHRLQAWIVRALVAGGRRPAIAMEMLDTDQSVALRGYLSRHPTDAGGIGAAVGWDRKGWSPWPIYAPIVQPALDAGTRILPANLSRPTIKAVARDGIGTLDPAQVAALRLGDPLPPVDHARMRQEIIDSHCRMLPDAMIEPMVTVLKSRDAFMASVLVEGANLPTADVAVLIAGGGHVRNDYGVPWHLRRLAPAKEVVSLTFLEVRDGEFDPDRYAMLFNVDELPFDYVWFTPRVDDADPCQDHAEELRRVKNATEAPPP